jgi:hypothetical protein
MRLPFLTIRKTEAPPKDPESLAHFLTTSAIGCLDHHGFCK